MPDYQMRNKRGQQTMGMPFGMIFAIFLIVVFIVIAGIAVSYFLDIGKSAGVGLFYDELQDAVDDAVRSQEVTKNFDVSLPSEIERICFANLSDVITNDGEDYEMIELYDIYEANVFLVPPEKAENMAWKWIDRIDIEAITSEQNPYCVDVRDDLTLTKNFYGKYVVIS